MQQDKYSSGKATIDGEEVWLAVCEISWNELKQCAVPPRYFAFLCHTDRHTKTFVGEAARTFFQQHYGLLQGASSVQ